MPSPSAHSHSLPVPRPALLLGAVVALAFGAVALDNCRLRRRLTQARRDPLTGLPTRPDLMVAGARMSSRYRDTVALFADANGLKSINDQFGHDAGDAAIQAMGHRLATWCASRSGLVARLGGDEFAAVVRLPLAACARDAALAELHRTVTDEPLAHGGHMLPLAVAIGAMPLADVPGGVWSHAMRAADAAMYRAKQAGTGPQIGRVADMTKPTVNGRRSGRPGTHWAAPARAGIR